VIFPSRAPELPAYHFKHGTVIVYCEHCGVWHHHGAQSLGHRWAHCGPESPYSDTGYTLVDAGPATPAILADMAKPRRTRRVRR
jgi:hypothetical protein